MPDAFLRVRGLTKTFPTARGTVHAVSDVSLDIPRGSITGSWGKAARARRRWGARCCG
jgi:ABC-type glutathione transport system ATPase component